MQDVSARKKTNCLIWYAASSSSGINLVWEGVKVVIAVRYCNASFFKKNGTFSFVQLWHIKLFSCGLKTAPSLVYDTVSVRFLLVKNI